MTTLRDNHTRHRLQIETNQLNRFLDQKAPGVRVSQVHHRQKKDRKTTEFNLITSLASGKELIQGLQAELRRFFKGFQFGMASDGPGHGFTIKASRHVPVAFFELITAACLEDLPAQTAVLGWASGEVPVLLHLDAPDNYHLLISGVEQSGKTSLLRTLIMSLALLNRPSRTQFVIASAAGGEPGGRPHLNRFRYIPHLLMPILTDRRAFAEAVGFLESEIRHRIEIGVTFPEIFLVVDDLQEFLHTNDLALVGRLAALARLGEKAGLHLILSTRFPDHPVLYDLLEADLPIRITGRTASPVQAEIATGLLDSGAERLLGEGDFLAGVNEELIYFQGAYLDDADLHYCLEHIHLERPPALVARQFNPRPVLPAAEREDSLILKDSHPDWEFVRAFAWYGEHFVKNAPETWSDCPLQDIVPSRGDRLDSEQGKHGAKRQALPEHIGDSGSLPPMRVNQSAPEAAVLVFSPDSRPSARIDPSRQSDAPPYPLKDSRPQHHTSLAAPAKLSEPPIHGTRQPDPGLQSSAPEAEDSDPWVLALVDPVVDPMAARPEDLQPASSDAEPPMQKPPENRSRLVRPWEKSQSQEPLLESHLKRLSNPESDLKIKTRLDREPAEENLLQEAAAVGDDLVDFDTHDNESGSDFPELEYEPFDD